MIVIIISCQTILLFCILFFIFCIDDLLYTWDLYDTICSETYSFVTQDIKFYTTEDNSVYRRVGRIILAHFISSE